MKSKRYFIILLFTFFIISASAQMDSIRYSFDFEKASFGELVKDVEAKTPFLFYYKLSDVETISVTLHVKDLSVSELLELILKSTDLHYAIDPSQNIFITKSTAISTELVSGFFQDELDENEKSIPSSQQDARVTTKDNSRGNKVYEIGSRNDYRPGSMVTLTGIIRNSDGLALSEASVQVEQLKISTITNSKGYYSIMLPAGRHELSIRYLGMINQHENILIYNSGILDIVLQEEVVNLNEVVIEAQGENASKVKSTVLGVEKLNMKEIKYIPTVFGEADLLRAVLTLPGVKTVGEASTGFNVRGGARDQNLILFNDATIYNPSHFFGLFSAFNPESVNEVELYKSAMPARYGGRLSSVLQITGKEGNTEKIKGSAGIGLITCRFNLEGPIVNNKTTFNAGVRTTYSNWIFKLLAKDSELKNTKAGFYDANLNVTHQINSNNSISLTSYLSHDDSNLNTDTLFSYNNNNVSLKWQHSFNRDLSSTLSVGQDHYDYNNNYHADSLAAYNLDFAINQQVVRLNFTYTPGNKHSFEFGLQSVNYSIEPGDLSKANSKSLVTPVSIHKERALETALYFEDQFNIGEKLALNGGLRYSIFNYLGSNEIRLYDPLLPKTATNAIDTAGYGNGKIINTYQGLDGRVSGRYSFTKNFSFKVGYTSTRQFIHMLSNTVALSPTDIWKLSDPNIKPQLSQQFSIGLYKNISNNKIELSVEGYRKKMSNYLDYKSGAQLFANSHIETEVFSTRGKAFGIETMIRKPRGNFNGWISYTYSRTLLRMDDPVAGENINKGQYYPANYDKPHDFTFVGNQKFSRRFSVSMNMTYSTGRPITIPIGIFYYGDKQKTLYSDRNSYRIQNYFRTDLSINIEGNHKIKQLTHSFWTVGAYNITGRKNPYSIYFTSQKGVVKGYKLSIFGSIIPFVNYNIRF